MTNDLIIFKMRRLHDLEFQESADSVLLVFARRWYAVADEFSAHSDFQMLINQTF